MTFVITEMKIIFNGSLVSRRKVKMKLTTVQQANPMNQNQKTTKNFSLYMFWGKTHITSTFWMSPEGPYLQKSHFVTLKKLRVFLKSLVSFSIQKVALPILLFNCLKIQFMIPALKEETMAGSLVKFEAQLVQIRLRLGQ